MSANQFINVPWSPRRLDRVVPRRAIERALRAELSRFKGTVLDIGCGAQPYRDLVLTAPTRVTSYVGMDLEGQAYGSPPDLVWDGRVMPLKDDSVDIAMATEVFEHCPNVGELIREAVRVLKPGGYLFFTVPFRRRD
jgi:2-polyprenyl-3-methyl-5-hydroxy-6-metoxy-1,4-benzoquinol methylase